uniref:DOT1 domain-containing protein n=1 Tax=Haptolina ericina TaxID=156174 RepID=A0A7S3AH73_9EUKA
MATLATRLGLGPVRQPCLAHYLSMYSAPCLTTATTSRQDSHFADLGSGCGRAVFQAAEDFGVASACGVELAPSRHARALALLDHAPPDITRRVEFFCGDVASDAVWAADGPLQRTTDVWLCSLCFDAALLEALALRISASETVQRVATLKPFSCVRSSGVDSESLDESGLCGFHEEVKEPCEMSWSVGLLVASAETEWTHPGVPVHIYTRN